MDVVPSYLELCLRLGRHVEGLVDAYYGPPELQKRIEAEEPRAPSALATDAVSLAESLDGLDESRRRWLEAQLRGLETVVRKLAGEEIDYEDEVERSYGVRPERVSEDAFEAAHRDLDEALPGTGSVAERYRAWREEDALRGEQARRVIDDLTSEFRARTEALVGLPDGDSFEVVYVSDELGGVQLLPGRAPEPDRDQHRHRDDPVVRRGTRGPRGLPGPPPRACLEGAAPRPRPRAGRGIRAHGRHGRVADLRRDRRSRPGDPPRRRGAGGDGCSRRGDRRCV